MKINRHSIHSGLLALAISALAISSSLAQMNYQGRLTDANGNSLTNGQYTIEFRLFNEAGLETWGPYTTDGTAGNGKGPRVDLVDGRFNTVIGNLDTTPRKFSDGFNGEEKRYLQIKVGNNPPITPRQLLLPAPIAAYATKAKSAESAQFLSNGSGDSPLNVDFTNGRVGVGTTSPNSRLHVNGDGVDPSLRVQVQGSSKFTVASNGGTSIGGFQDTPPVDGLFVQGNVGIGTATAGFPLTFDTTFGDKISLFGQSGNSVGFGVQSSRLQIHTDVIGSDIVFGYGNSASMTETMRIRGNGLVGIGTTNPQANLDVAGFIKEDGQHTISGEEDLRLMRGNVAANGTAISGSGFTSSVASAVYTITYTNAFRANDIPVVTANAIAVSGGALAGLIDSSTNTGFTIRFAAENVTVARAVPFNFIVAGRR